MKEIFDKRYPVTSFFLLVTALVFLLMLVLTGLNFERADTLLQFGAMYGPIIVEPVLGQISLRARMHKA